MAHHLLISLFLRLWIPLFFFLDPILFSLLRNFAFSLSRFCWFQCLTLLTRSLLLTFDFLCLSKNCRVFKRTTLYMLIYPPPRINKWLMFSSLCFIPTLHRTKYIEIIKQNTLYFLFQSIISLLFSPKSNHPHEFDEYPSSQIFMFTTNLCVKKQYVALLCKFKIFFINSIMLYVCYLIF